MGPRAGIPREEPRQIGMMTPEMLAMITQAVQTVVQSEMARAREVEVARLAETARVDNEARIARETEAERIRAAEIAREAGVAEKIRLEAERARIV